MEYGDGSQQGGGGGHGWSTASSASPASPSSAFDQQRQRQLFQQQFLRRAEGNDAYLAYQAGNVRGVTGGFNIASSSGSMQLPQQPRNFIDLGQQQVSSLSGSMQLPQQPRNFIDLGQQQVSPDIPRQNNNRNQGAEQQMMNPTQQAYLQYAIQANQQKSTMGMQFPQQQQQMNIPRLFGSLSKDQEMQMTNSKIQGLTSIQASHQFQSQASSSKRLPEQADYSNQFVPDHRTNPRLNHPTLLGQAMPSQMLGPQSQQNLINMTNKPMSAAEQMHALAARMVAQQKTNESSANIQPASFGKPHVTSPHVGNESYPRGNSSSDFSGHSGSSKARQTVSPNNLGGYSSAPLVNNSGSMTTQQLSMHGGDNNQFPPRQFTLLGQRMSPWQMSGSLNHVVEGSRAKSSPDILVGSQTQNARQLNRLPSQSASPSNDNDVGNPSTSQGGLNTPMLRSHNGFTKEQMRTLKAQILSFKRLKKGEGLPRVLLQCIVPPPIDLQVQQVSTPRVATNKDISAGENEDEHAQHMDSSEKVLQTVKPPTAASNIKEGGPGDGRAGASTVNVQSSTISVKDPRFTVPSGKEEQESLSGLGNQKTPVRNDLTDKGKGIAPHPSILDSMPAKKPIQANSTSQPKDAGSTREYHGPLFDSPVFTQKHETLGSSMLENSNNLTLAYDIKDLFGDEGADILKKKREEKIGTIDKIIAVNLERKRISPDLVLRLQIESKKLQLAEYQARLRDEIEQQQRVIMDMPNRPYEKFLRLCRLQRQDLNRQAHANRKATREKELKSIFKWRKKFLDANWAIRDAQIARNRGVRKYHEKMLRDFSKNNDDDHNKRMEALKNNDVERYRQMLLEQQTNVPGEASERYAVLSSFLTETEEYINKLGGKITATKKQQEVEEAATAAAAVARAQGLSGKELRAAAACAREEVMIKNRFSEMDAPQDSSSVNKYYNLAHAVDEKVIRQPSMLQAGTLRDYQLVGLQWMLSLYNNKLNGILADEMGLGKTVQVMALIAYLMEFKGDYGPHLIIVPNAVLVNWKSELRNWLPSVSCIYYVGGKDQRAKLFSQEVLALKFNVLVTTYEFIMYDRSKLSKIDWKYIVIDEAQRMKDRKSKLACDLDRYRCQRRLLLTGTPLQNDLEELWSLLNLLLPDVFDNKKVFHDWFSPQFQKEAPSHSSEDDWLETEKKVIVIHRLHQILEPFMLRRRLEDVEGSLPPKDSIVLKCRMSSIQGAIYDWIKSTGTIRVSPEEEKHVLKRNPNYQPKVYKPLKNKCMELRKACNHPLLSYPYFSDLSKDFLVRSCGKLWVLDRVLIKLQRTGHRVLLFSTMTKLLDLMEEYLQWRGLVFRRIDGTTKLEDRENAIVEFNRPNSDCFIFLLSIRAAGRGLNLQSADTVIIYDPDPNPKNEEQAVARAHRIGQKREVKVIYMEAVVDKISSHQKEDEFTSGGLVDSDDDLAGKDRYMGSIESLIRNNIQQYKIDMADEVINAGRFDQRTTQEERRLTLEALLHDDERYQETVHDVPSLREVNRMIARSKEEVELFDRMDEEFGWAEDMTRYDEIPDWIRSGTVEVNETVASLSNKPPRNYVDLENIVADSAEPEKRRRGKANGKAPVYTEIDDGSMDFSDGDEFSEAPLPQVKKNLPEYPRGNANKILKQAATSGSSSSQKFVSLSALDNRLVTRSKKSVDELEEAETALSGDSDGDEGEDLQILQANIKRKRSIRFRPQLKEKRKNMLAAKEDHDVHRNSTRKIVPSIKNTGRMIYASPNERGKESLDMKGPEMSEVTQRKCKKVLSKIQRRIDNEGRGIIPVLTRLWKNMEHADNLDLRKIELRLEKFEYGGVMDFVSDVQLMLKRGMQHYKFCHEVRSEAKKVHDLLLDILNIVFPEINLQEIRSSLSFSPSVAAGSSSRNIPTDQNKRLKSPIQRVEGSNKDKSHMPQEKLRLGSGELVNCKRKRKEEEKSSSGVMSISVRENTSGGSGSVRWANPAKKMRTDGVRRRHSHMSE